MTGGCLCSKKFHLLVISVVLFLSSKASCDDKEASPAFGNSESYSAGLNKDPTSVTPVSCLSSSPPPPFAGSSDQVQGQEQEQELPGVQSEAAANDARCQRPLKPEPAVEDRCERSAETRGSAGTKGTVLLLSQSLAGHLIPLVALGQELISRGYSVHLAAPWVSERMPGRLIEGTGICHISAGVEAMSEEQRGRHAVALTGQVGPFTLMWRLKQFRMEKGAWMAHNLLATGTLGPPTGNLPAGRPPVDKPSKCPSMPGRCASCRALSSSRCTIEGRPPDAPNGNNKGESADPDEQQQCTAASHLAEAGGDRCAAPPSSFPDRKQGGGSEQGHSDCDGRGGEEPANIVRPDIIVADLSAGLTGGHLAELFDIPLVFNTGTFNYQHRRPPPFPYPLFGSAVSLQEMTLVDRVQAEIWRVLRIGQLAGYLAERQARARIKQAYNLTVKIYLEPGVMHPLLINTALDYPLPVGPLVTVTGPLLFPPPPPHPPPPPAAAAPAAAAAAGAGGSSSPSSCSSRPGTNSGAAMRSPKRARCARCCKGEEPCEEPDGTSGGGGHGLFPAGCDSGCGSGIGSSSDRGSGRAGSGGSFGGGVRTSGVAMYAGVGKRSNVDEEGEKVGKNEGAPMRACMAERCTDSCSCSSGNGGMGSDAWQEGGGNGDDREEGSSASEVQSWLDRWRARSVVVVSMGSLVQLSEAQGRALLAGVTALGRPVLWAAPVGARTFLADEIRAGGGRGGQQQPEEEQGPPKQEQPQQGQGWLGQPQQGQQQQQAQELDQRQQQEQQEQPQRQKKNGPGQQRWHRQRQQRQRQLRQRGCAGEVRVERWIAQREVLAHGATGVLVGHCGAGGVQEALLHAVPVLCLPFFLDQPGVAARLRDSGAGLSIDPRQLSAARVSVALRKLIGRRRRCHYSRCRCSPCNQGGAAAEEEAEYEEKEDERHGAEGEHEAEAAEEAEGGDGGRWDDEAGGGREADGAQEEEEGETSFVRAARRMARYTRTLGGVRRAADVVEHTLADGSAHLALPDVCISLFVLYRLDVYHALLSTLLSACLLAPLLLRALTRMLATISRSI